MEAAHAGRAVPGEIQRALSATIVLWLLPVAYLVMTFHHWGRFDGAGRALVVGLTTAGVAFLLLTVLPYWRLRVGSERARLVLWVLHVIAIIVTLHVWVPFFAYMWFLGFLMLTGEVPTLTEMLVVVFLPGLYVAVMVYCLKLLASPRMCAFTRSRRPREPRLPPAWLEKPPVTLHAAAAAAVLGTGVPVLWFRSGGFVALAALYALLVVLTYRRSDVARRLLVFVSGAISLLVLAYLALGLAVLPPPVLAEWTVMEIIAATISGSVMASHLVLTSALLVPSTRAFTAGVPPALSDPAPVPPHE